MEFLKLDNKNKYIQTELCVRFTASVVSHNVNNKIFVFKTLTNTYH